MRLRREVLERLMPDVELVIELVVSAFGKKEIPNGAILIGLGAVIGLTLNDGMPGPNRPEPPDVEEILPFLEAGMAFGRDIKIDKLQ